MEEIVGAAVERSGGNDLVAGAGQSGDDESLGSLSGGGCQAGGSAFEGGNALLKDVGGGVHDAGVDVAELLESEETGRVIGIVKDVGGGLVDRHGARLGGGIDLLAGVNGQGCETKLLLGVVVAVVGHCCYLFPFLNSAG